MPPESKANSQPLIDMKDVSKTYVNAAGKFEALKAINLQFYEGEFVGVIGKSGSGKSTLVNMITGIDRPTSGEVIVDGVNVHALRESKQARWRGLNLGVVFQFFQLLPMLTLLENVLLPMDFCNKYQPEERVERGLNLLAMMGLQNDAHALPGAVSAGQQQSAAIARALANDPPIIVADEPTGNLDAKTADAVYDKFESLAAQGQTIIMITHDPEIEQRLSRKVLISDGEVIPPLLAKSLAGLPHPMLLRLGHQLETRTLSSDTQITIPAAESDDLFLIQKGELFCKPKDPSQTTINMHLTQGDYFTNVDHALFSNANAQHLRTGSTPVELSILPWAALEKEIKSISGADARLRETWKTKMKEMQEAGTNTKGLAS